MHRITMKQLALVSLAIVILTGCPSRPPEGTIDTQSVDAAKRAAEPKSPVFRGHLRQNGDRLRFETCLNGSEMGVMDNTDGAVTKILDEYTSQQGWYVEFKGKIVGANAEGAGDSDLEQMRIDELRYCAALPETHGCSQALAGVEFVASGNEPSWTLAVSEGGIVFDQIWRERIAPLNLS